MENLHFVVSTSFTYDRIEFSFFAKYVKYIYNIEYLHFNAQQHLYRGFLFENMKFPRTRTSKNWKIHDFLSF